MAYLRKYDPPEPGMYVAGVPARDIPEAEWNALPEDLREQAAHLYTRVSDAPTTRRTARVHDAPDDDGNEPDQPAEEVNDAGN